MEVKPPEKGKFIVNLSETTDEGDFSCPSCGKLISPKDTTLNQYAIRGAQFSDDRMVVEIEIYCFCGAFITLCV